jgi:hypothetical protein
MLMRGWPPGTPDKGSPRFAMRNKHRFFRVTKFYPDNTNHQISPQRSVAMKAIHPAVESAERPLTTNAFAALLGILPKSLHRRVCKTGSYYGVVPTKLPNRTLLWPHDALEQLAATKAA